MLSEVTHLVIRHGVYAVIALMALDALLPAGGEVTMLLAGATAAGAVSGVAPVLFGTTLVAGPEAYVVLALAGTLGYVIGAVAGWVIGRRGGGPMLKRYAHRIGRGPEDLRRAEHWFARHRNWAVLLGRVTPIVRSFVSVVAGAFGTPLAPYVALTVLGSALWCFTIAGVGWIAGHSYERLGHAVGYVDVVVVAVAFGVVWAVRRRRSRSVPPPATSP